MLDLAVIESRWWGTGNVSVRGLFDLISGILRNNPDAYHHEMFNNAASLREIVPRTAGKKHIKNLVIAAHGDATAIYGAEGETNEENRISRAVLRRILRNLPRDDLNGLYLGTCSTANMDTVKFVLDEGRVRWVAGYSREIDWLESASVDLYFWTTYYGTNRAGGERMRVQRVANRMEPVKDLCHKLGFNVFRRRLGRSGGVEALLTDH